VADKVQVNPDQLTKAGNNMLAVQQKMNNIITALDNAVGKAGAETWGNDRFGNGFADGGNGYIASRKQLLSGGHEMAASLQQFGQGMIDAAKTLSIADNPDGQQKV
jgi:hypothetical protein